MSGFQSFSSRRYTEVPARPSSRYHCWNDEFSVRTSKSSGRTSKSSGRTSKSSGRASKPSGRTSKPSGRMSKPSGRTSKPSIRMSKPSGRASKPSGEIRSSGGLASYGLWVFCPGLLDARLEGLVLHFMSWIPVSIQSPLVVARRFFWPYLWLCLRLCCCRSFRHRL